MQTDANITVLEGFTIVSLADNLGPARHLTVRDNGNIYVALRRPVQGNGPIQSPGQAIPRPMGLAGGPNGRLYISDSVRGRIWRVEYVN